MNNLGNKHCPGITRNFILPIFFVFYSFFIYEIMILYTLSLGVSRFVMAESMHWCSKASHKRIETLYGINKDTIGMFHGTQYPHESTAKFSLFSKSHPSFEYLRNTCIPSISSDSLQPLLFKSMSLRVIYIQLLISKSLM